MGYLFNELWFAPQSRMTGVWAQEAVGDTEPDAVAMVHRVTLGTFQDGSVESDFLASHLPFCAGGFHGVGPDGSPWVALAQVAPPRAASTVGAANPFWPLMDGVDRALHHNAEASTLSAHGWSRDELVQVYAERGVDPSDVQHWTAHDLVKGLLAECCNVPLAVIVAGQESGCAFPETDHLCEQDVFRDVFAQWATGSLTIELEPEESGDEIDTVLHVGYCWPGDLLDAWSTKKLRNVARRAGWKKSKVQTMSRVHLMRLLAKPRSRRRPGAYRLVRVPAHHASPVGD